MAGWVFPYNDPDSWKSITLGGDRVPGVTEVKWSRGRKLSEKSPSGRDGGSLTDKGVNLADITFTTTLSTALEFASFSVIYEKSIKGTRQLTKRNVVSVVHPDLARADIVRCFIFDESGLVDKGGGIFEVTYKGKEFNDKTQIGGGSGTTKKLKPNTDFNALGSAFGLETKKRTASEVLQSVEQPLIERVTGFRAVTQNKAQEGPYWQQPAWLTTAKDAAFLGAASKPRGRL